MNINNIREMIRRITNCYGTKDPYQLIKAMNIKLDYLPDYTDINKLKGCYGMVNSTKVILIHPRLEENERREVFAHELGHALIHPTTNALFLATYTYFRLEKYEIEADTFAAELLLDDDIYYEYMGRSNDFIASCENVPLRFVDYKIKNFRNRIPD